jgi:hypothetical protein
MRACWRCRTEIEEPPAKREPDEAQPERRERIPVAAAAAGMAVDKPVAPGIEPPPIEAESQPAPVLPHEEPEPPHEQPETPHEQPEPVTEAIEQAPPLPPDVATAAQPSVQYASPPPVVPVRVMEPWPPSSDPQRSKLRPLRVTIIGVLAGLLVATGLLVGEGVFLEYRYPDPRTVELSDQPFAQLGFSIDVPLAWDVDAVNSSVTFSDPDRPDDRGWRVVAETRSFETARNDLDRFNRARFSSFIRLARTTDELVSGRSAIRSEFIGNDLEYRQWWIDGGRDGSFRLESWFHPAEGDEAIVLDQRMVETFDVL